MRNYEHHTPEKDFGIFLWKTGLIKKAGDDVKRKKTASDGLLRSGGSSRRIFYRVTGRYKAQTCFSMQLYAAM